MKEILLKTKEKKQKITIENCFTFIDNNALSIELIILLISLILSIFLQCIAYRCNLLQKIDSEWLHDFYNWILGTQTDDLLRIIDGFAIIVGGLSFFLKKWVDKDTENIVFLLIIIFALILSHILKLFHWHIISFFMMMSVGLLLLIPFSFLIYDSLLSSERRIIRLNTFRIKEGKNEKKKQKKNIR